MKPSWKLRVQRMYVPYTKVLDEEEEQCSMQDPEPLNDFEKSNQTIDRLTTLLKIVTTLLIVAFILLTLSLFSENSPAEPTESKSRGEFLTPVPEIPQQIITFQKNELYAERPTPATDREWDALLPPGRGFVYINNSASYNLQPGQKTPWGEIYSVSLFHQLHCLGELRKYHWMLMDGILSDDPATFNETKKKAETLSMNGGEHVNHCIDYIRQGIMCAGDMTMEWPREEPDGRRIAVDGWGVPHECKNWDAIKEYMIENYFDHSIKSSIAPDRR